MAATAAGDALTCPAVSGPASQPASPPNAHARRGGGLTSRARLLVAAGAGVLAAAVALLLANALNSPVGAGDRDPTPAMPAAVGGVNPGTAAGLPPLALVLDRQAPGGISQLSAAEQVPRLRALITPTSPARRHVELGAALQSLGDHEGAEEAFREALRRAPGDLAATVGLILVPAAAGGETEMAAAAQELEALRRPGRAGQLVDFNRAWLEIYRGNPETARTALEQTVAGGDDTTLGRTAATLLQALERGAAPTP